jgi:uncharacterized protein YqeY
MSATISERIVVDLKTAMKARDKPRVGAIRMLRAAMIEAEKSGSELTEARAVTILRKLRKQRVEAAETYEKAGRQDLADQELAEAVIIDAYLPQLADEAQTLVWVQQAVAGIGANSPNQLGRVMGALMKAHKGEVDAGLARKLIAAELSA